MKEIDFETFYEFADNDGYCFSEDILAFEEFYNPCESLEDNYERMIDGIDWRLYK